MYRAERPLTLAYRNESVTFDMPGWYCDASDEAHPHRRGHELSDRMLNRLKARAEGLLESDEMTRGDKDAEPWQSR